MISQFTSDSAQIEAGLGISPAHAVFSVALKELYGSKNQLMRTLLKLENNALNSTLHRLIHDYFEVSRLQVYSIEHVFELLDEVPEGLACALTDACCRNAMAMLNTADHVQGNDKRIRSVVAELFAQEITSLDYLFNLALSMERMDVANIISDMQRRTRDAFGFGFSVTLADVAA